MKKILSIVTFALSFKRTGFAFLFLTFNFVNAQSPQGTSYQAVIRNSSGVLISNRTVTLRFSLHDSSANGNVVYQETQNPVTTAQGLVNVNVGQGTAVVGSFASINWGNKGKFLQVELDVNGGAAYTDMGTTQLMSVPYSLFANKSQKSDTALYAVNSMPSGTAAGQMMYWNGSSWVNVNPGSNGQSLIFCNGVPQWGPCLILPTVQTGSITSKTAITATAGGNVTDSGSAKITGRGVCYSTTINPTIANTKTASGTNVIGAFTVSLTGLSALTTYHYRAYATTSVGTSYGADSVFTTNAASVPTLTTTAASAITAITATSGGNITSDNGAAITARGVCWSTTANPTTALTTKTIDGTGTGAFTSSITGLNPNTTYYVRAYATNSVGTSYGTQISFTTLRLPAVTTGSISSITNTTATASGNVTDSGSRTVTARGICYSTTPSPLITNSIVVTNATNTIGSFTVPLSGLSANTRYYVRAFVTTNVGTSYGVDSVFTTASAVANLPSVTIGTQVWSSKNLDVAKYRNGDIIPKVTDPTQWAALTTGAWCWYNNDSASYASTYGRLYNGYAVNDPRGLAPQGWHVPSNSEWNKLIKYIDIDADTTCNICSQTNNAIAVMAMTSISGWGWVGTNSSGFNALPAGYRESFGLSNYFGHGGFWFSATIEGGALIGRILDGGFSREVFTNNFGLSVRLVRDTIISPILPTVSTSIVSSETSTSALTGGVVSSDGGVITNARGVCWSTTPNPTIALSTKTIDNSGVGTFNSSITGLTPNTTYYVRAYATNSVGTAYGNQQTFTTASTTVLPSVTIGTQIWSSKNLDVRTYRNGDPIPQVTDSMQWASLTTGAWCWYNNDSATYASTYGRLYNWYSVNDPRGLAPQGWHVPTNIEWDIMIKYIDSSVDTTCICYSGSSIGTQLKNTTGWNSSGNGTNSSGFAGLPGGNRQNNGGFGRVGSIGFWWSLTEYVTGYAWSRQLSSNIGRVNNFKSQGFSVRVIRD